MKRRDFLLCASAACALSLAGGASPVMAAGDGKTVVLKKPEAGGKPLVQCLAERATNRAIDRGDVDLDTLGALLWAAWGVNRDNGKHVVPTAMNRQECQVYAVRGDGVWEYMPKEHAVRRVLEGDRRGAFDGSGLILLYCGPKDERGFAAMHAGSMYQNVGLMCASLGLANCVKRQKHDALDRELPLPKGWQTFITHSIGKPAA